MGVFVFRSGLLFSYIIKYEKPRAVSPYLKIRNPVSQREFLWFLRFMSPKPSLVFIHFSSPDLCCSQGSSSSMAVPVDPSAANSEALANPAPPAAPLSAFADPGLPAPPAPAAQPVGAVGEKQEQLNKIF